MWRCIFEAASNLKPTQSLMVSLIEYQIIAYWSQIRTWFWFLTWVILSVLVAVKKKSRDNDAKTDIITTRLVHLQSRLSVSQRRYIDRFTWRSTQNCFISFQKCHLTEAQAQQCMNWECVADDRMGLWVSGISYYINRSLMTSLMVSLYHGGTVGCDCWWMAYCVTLERNLPSDNFFLYSFLRIK